MATNTKQQPKIIRNVIRIGGGMPAQIISQGQQQQQQQQKSAATPPPLAKVEPKPMVQDTAAVPKSPRPEFLEPIANAKSPRVNPVELYTMRMAEVWEEEMERPEFWVNKIEQLEKEREKYNKKRGWSADDLDNVEKIDQEIKFCEYELDELTKEYDEYEEEYADAYEAV